MIVRLLCVALAALFAGPVLAQEPWTPPGACKAATWSDVEKWREWNSHTPPDNATRWAEEKPRYADSRDVWRVLDRLHIAIDGGRVLTLSDCAYGDDLHFYIYERWDQAGGFHIVRTYFHEDHLYALVMRRTGRIYTGPGRPIWSPDRTRFAYSVCDLLNGKEEFAILGMADDRPKEEIKVPLPCTLGDCKLVWEGNTMVSATCEDPQGKSRNRQVVRLTRKGDGWISTTSGR